MVSYLVGVLVGVGAGMLLLTLLSNFIFSISTRRFGPRIKFDGRTNCGAGFGGGGTNSG